MIKAMAAIDSKKGIANEHGIVWDLPADREHVHQAIKGQAVLMGYRTYLERKGPRTDGGKSYVIVRPETELNDGFVPVADVANFLEAYRNGSDDVWIMGGAKVYQDLLPEISELHITRVEGDFKCTKFFPDFETSFTKVESQPPIQENGISFHYEKWLQNT